MRHRNRMYVDTSVIGGVFDDDFSETSLRLFDEVKSGKYTVVLSEITLGELRDAPSEVREFLTRLPDDAVEEITFTEEMAELRDAYLAAQVVGPRWSDDAAHVAAATVARVDVILSWNFRHIVNWDRIRAFNSVNLAMGYPLMTILSPTEVVTDEEEV